MEGKFQTKNRAKFEINKMDGKFKQYKGGANLSKMIEKLWDFQATKKK